MKQITQEEAIRIHDSKLYEDWSFEQIAKFQINQNKLAIPFDKFHEAVEKTIGRPVFTHEFALNREGITREINGIGEAPTFDEIVSMIPENKRVLIFN